MGISPEEIPGGIPYLEVLEEMASPRSNSCRNLTVPGRTTAEILGEIPKVIHRWNFWKVFQEESPE